MPKIRPPLRIGLSPRFLHRSPLDLGLRGKTLQYLEESIAHWVMTQDALIFMIPSIEAGGLVRRSNLSVADYVDALDGLVLQGGADVSPRTYGQEPLSAEWHGDRVRDQYEIELLRGFIAGGKPVLGICRGAQLINVAFGGTLWQDVASAVPSAVRHYDIDKYDENFHAVMIQPDSLLSRLLPCSQSQIVTSIHHQAIRDLGENVGVEARSEDDGLVEAIRWHGSGWVLGLQWHPEFHHGREGMLDCTPVLEEFLREARRRKTV
jgi:gamma-glutamyl-gamma-aminobutyrate hydrolase PuuD